MKVAALQYTATANLDVNLKKIESLLMAHKAQNIDLCLLPENFALMATTTQEKLDIQESLGVGKVQTWLSEISQQYQLWLVAGSFPISSVDPHKPYARCLVYNPQGELVSYYDKIHLFDVAVSKSESYCESKDTFAGDKAITLQVGDFKIGLSICYDLRFPELYRYYQQQQVDLLLAPSAFTYDTGKQHWDLLTRARAVENLCFMLAANQTGIHDNGRRTFGHSQIIDPWGRVLAKLEEEEALVVSEICKSDLINIRQKFPAHTHRKL